MYLVRIKDLRRREERIRKVAELVGASAMDPVDKTRELFQMFKVSV